MDYRDFVGETCVCQCFSSSPPFSLKHARTLSSLSLQPTSLQRVITFLLYILLSAHPLPPLCFPHLVHPSISFPLYVFKPLTISLGGVLFIWQTHLHAGPGLGQVCGGDDWCFCPRALSAGPPAVKRWYESQRASPPFSSDTFHNCLSTLMRTSIFSCAFELWALAHRQKDRDRELAELKPFFNVKDIKFKCISSLRACNL